MMKENENLYLRIENYLIPIWDAQWIISKCYKTSFFYQFFFFFVFVIDLRKRILKSGLLEYLVHYASEVNKHEQNE